MSKARWWRNLALIIALLGGASAAILHMTRPLDGVRDWHDVAFILAVCAVLYALVSLPFVQRSYRRDIRLRRGENVLARWTVPSAEWHQFVMNERQWREGEGVRINLVDTSQRAATAGIEIIVGSDAVIVGNSFYSLNGIGMMGRSGPFWVASNPPTLEFHIAITDVTDTTVDRCLRFPVASGSENAAQSIAVN